MTVYLIAPISLLILTYFFGMLGIDKKYNIIIGMSVLIIFSVIRDIHVGADLNNYLNIFHDIDDESWGNLLAVAKRNNIEWGYAVFNKLCSVISSNGRIYIFIVSLIVNGIFGFFFYKYSKNPYMSMYMYITWGFYIHTFNIMRQMLAISLLILSVHFLFQNKKRLFYCFVIIAFLIHHTAICFIVVPVFMNKRFSLKCFLSLITICVLISEISTSLLRMLSKLGYSDYSYVIGTGKGDRGGLFVAAWLVLVVYLCVYRIWVTCNWEMEFYFFMHSVAIIFLLLAINYNLVGRIAYYFLWVLTIIVPNILELIKKSNYGIIKLIGYMGMLAFSYYFYWCILNADTDRILPYSIGKFIV